MISYFMLGALSGLILLVIAPYCIAFWVAIGSADTLLESEFLTIYQQ